MLIIAIALIIFGASAWTAFGKQLTGFEASTFRAINDLPNGLQIIMKLATEFGAVVTLPAILLPLLVMKRYLLALQVFLAGGAAFVVAEIAKKLVDRPRPFDLLQNVHQRIAESGPGFPSGHTTFATVLAVTLALAFGGKWRWIAFLWITMVGVSRIYLGVHSLLDIIGGICIGVGVAVFTDFVFRNWGQKAQAKLLEKRPKAR